MCINAPGETIKLVMNTKRCAAAGAVAGVATVPTENGAAKHAGADVGRGEQGLCLDPGIGGKKAQ